MLMKRQRLNSCSIRTEVESIASRRSEDHDESDGVFEQIRPKSSSERVGRDPEPGPWKNALPTTFSDNPRGTYHNCHQIAKGTDGDEQVERLNLFAIAEHIDEEEVGNGKLAADNVRLGDCMGQRVSY